MTKYWWLIKEKEREITQNEIHTCTCLIRVCAIVFGYSASKTMS
jgi:hypothetical protein